MAFKTRVNKLTDYAYSPTDPASEDAIRLQVDNAVQEAYDNVQSALSSIADGDSGGDNVKITPIYVLDTVQGALEELKQELINIVQAGLTTGAVTDVYLSDLPGMIKERLGDVIERQNNTDLTLLYNDLNDFVENLSPVSFVDVFPNETYTAPETTANYNSIDKTYEFDNTGLELYQTVSLAFSAFTKATALLIPKEIKEFTPDQDYTGVNVIEGTTNEYTPDTNDKLYIGGQEVGITNVSGGSAVYDWTTTPYSWTRTGVTFLKSLQIGGQIYGVWKSDTVGLHGIDRLNTDGNDVEIWTNTVDYNFSEESVQTDGTNIFLLVYTNRPLLRVINTEGTQVSSTFVDDAQTSIESVALSISGSNIFVGMISTNPSTTNNNDNVRGRLGTHSNGVITWGFATEQITDINDPIVNMAVELDSGVPIMTINFDNVGSKNFLILLRRDALLSTAAWLSSPWTQRTIDSTGTKDDFSLLVKQNGADTGRIFMGYTKTANFEIRYTDDGGLTDTLISMQTNASKADMYEQTVGDLRTAYQKTDGSIGEKVIPNDSETPGSETVLFAVGTDPSYMLNQDNSVQNGNYSVLFDNQLGGEQSIGSLLVLTLDQTVTVLQANSYLFTTQFSPLLNDGVMTFAGVSKGGLVYEQENPATDSVFKTTGKSVDLDGIGIAVY